MRSYTVTIPEGGYGEVHTIGSSVSVTAAAGVVVVETSENTRVELQNGQSVGDLKQYQWVKFYAKEGTEQQIEVVLGVGVLDSAAIKATVKSSGNTGINALPMIITDGSVQEISANSGRAVLELVADSLNSGSVWVGGIVNAGLPLDAGDTCELNVSGNVELIGLAGQKVYVLEVLE